MSCGCLGAELKLKHGHAPGDGRTSTPTFRAWSGMRDRCNNPNASSWKRYGGRGIRACERWNEFANFLSDMGEKPIGSSLDRIDNDGNYEPGNCRWASVAEQNRNTSRNRRLTWNGKTLCVADWEKKLGAPIRRRLCLGWSIERALTTPRTRKSGSSTTPQA